MAVRRSGAPWWSFATRTSVRWPTTSRPRRIQPRRRSSSRSPAPSSRAARSDAGTPAGSRTRRSAPARRANATRRLSWSAGCGGRVGGNRRGGRPAPRARWAIPCAWTGPSRAPARSSTRRSTARAWRSDPAIASASSTESGTRTASHSRRTPRATASTGSRLRARSTQATRAPPAWASATVRRARVVAPLDPMPRRTTVPARGRPPAVSSASSSGKPVEMRRSTPPSGSPGSCRAAGAGAGRAPPGRGTRAGRAGAEGHGERSGARGDDLGERGGRPGLRRERGGRERPEDLHRGPRRGRSPAGPEAREGGSAVGVVIHRTSNTRTSVLCWEGPNDRIASEPGATLRPALPQGDEEDAGGDEHQPEPLDPARALVEQEHADRDGHHRPERAGDPDQPRLGDLEANREGNEGGGVQQACRDDQAGRAAIDAPTRRRREQRGGGPRGSPPGSSSATLAFAIRDRSMIGSQPAALIGPERRIVTAAKATRAKSA